DQAAELIAGAGRYNPHGPVELSERALDDGLVHADMLPVGRVSRKEPPMLSTPRKVFIGLDRAANAPRVAAEAAIAGDHPAMVRSLMRAAEEWVTCGDLFPGPVLAERAAQLARRHGLTDLTAQADALKTQLAGRMQLPDPEGQT